MRFKEEFPVQKSDDSLRGFAMRFTEEYRVPIKCHGHVWAILRNADGSEQFFDLAENLVVNVASILVARLLANKNDPVWGIKYLAVGTGDPLWDPAAPPAPTGAETGLVAEIARKTFTSVNFIDPITGAVTTTPTNVVDYVTIFDQTEAVGGLMEMSLMGGDAISTPVAYANGGKNTDTPFNVRRFAVIHKPATSTLTFVWRITT